MTSAAIIWAAMNTNIRPVILCDRDALVAKGLSYSCVYSRHHDTPVTNFIFLIGETTKVVGCVDEVYESRKISFKRFYAASCLANPNKSGQYNCKKL